MAVITGTSTPEASSSATRAVLTLDASHQDPLVTFLTTDDLDNYYDQTMDRDETNILGRGSFGAVFKG